MYVCDRPDVKERNDKRKIVRKSETDVNDIYYSFFCFVETMLAIFNHLQSREKQNNLYQSV